MPVRIQRKRSKGWRMPPNTVYVGRPSIFANPAKVGKLFRGEMISGNGAAVRAFELEIHHPNSCLAFTPNDIGELKGRNLACWCRLDQPCHADVLLDIANKEQQNER